MELTCRTIDYNDFVYSRARDKPYRVRVFFKFNFVQVVQYVPLLEGRVKVRGFFSAFDMKSCRKLYESLIQD